jgi:hypothetical protein
MLLTAAAAAVVAGCRCTCAEVWVKTPQVLMRDRLMSNYTVKPALARLKRTLLGLGGAPCSSSRISSRVAAAQQCLQDSIVATIFVQLPHWLVDDAIEQQQHCVCVCGGARKRCWVGLPCNLATAAVMVTVFYHCNSQVIKFAQGG